MKIVCVCVCKRQELTFDFLYQNFLVSASYFLSDASNSDDDSQLWEVGEWRRPQQHYGAQETGCLGGIGETGRGQTGAWPVVHLEEKEGAGQEGERERKTLWKNMNIITVPMWRFVRIMTKHNINKT